MYSHDCNDVAVVIAFLHQTLMIEIELTQHQNHDGDDDDAVVAVVVDDDNDVHMHVLAMMSERSHFLQNYLS